MQILNTNECSSVLEVLIQSAKKFVILITPYIQISPRIESLLHIAGQEGVAIFLVARERLKKEEYAKVKDLEKLTICIHPPLHAKVYFNENDVLLTSLNLYEFSQQNNTEIGIVFSRKEQKESYMRVVGEFKNIIHDKRSQVPIDKLSDKEIKQFEKAINGSWF